MGNAGPGVLGSMLFLMLGLQPLPLSRGRSLHHPPNSRSFHPGSRHHGSTWEKLKSCEGAFDLYFIVDASQKAKDIWEDICQLVDEITTKYTNPDLRMSFITYSTQGRIVMKLTSDRTKIRDGLKRLQDIVPTGATNMQEGLKEANKQIQQATSGDRNTSSLIITLTAGPLLPRTLQDTKKEAQQARDMGAKVYCVGVKDYERDQLNDIVERKDQMYGTEEFNSAETFVTSLVKNSCMEAMAGDTHFVCLGVAYDVTFFASGLDEKRKDEIVCRYQLGSGKVFDEKPISMNQGKLICPGHIFDKAGQEVFIDYSLNNGVSFIGEDLKIVSKDCVNDRVGLREPQWTAAWEEETEDAGASWEEEVRGENSSRKA
ncbi:anthrax toxin receptor-like [Bos indicus]|uniref:Anthrax toxin receptor-like n=1 Tax=Bos indicus TaxID=9915 RepID=A0ABM4RQU5_BOSIN